MLLLSPDMDCLIGTSWRWVEGKTDQNCLRQERRLEYRHWVHHDGNGDSSVVRAPDSWSKGCGFESLLEQQENCLLRGQLSVLTLISVSVPPPVLPQQHVKDPSHSAKSAGGRLQLNTHTPYVCGFAWSDTVHGCMVYTERTETDSLAADSCGTSHVSAVSTPLQWIFKNAL